METKRIITCAFVMSLIFGSNLLGMEKITEAHQYFIKIHNTLFPVSKNVLEKFEVYNTTKQFERKAETEDKSIFKTETGVVWDITPSIQEILPENPSEKDWLSFTKLIDLMIDIASNKFDPYRVENRNTLFMIIKVADLLKNKELMQKCTPALIIKLTGPLLASPIKTFESGASQKESFLYPELNSFFYIK